MNEVETFLKFTTESSEDFEDGWLATLDTSLKVDQYNQVLFRYWEKPTNTNRVVQKRTAMGENLKVQILTAEVIRRLANTADGVDKEDYAEIVDRIAQKMINSGYGEDQTRRIIVAGIKGWRSKVDRRSKDGTKLRRTAKDSQEQRERDKLLGKTNWFRKQKSTEQLEEDQIRVQRRPGRSIGRRNKMKDGRGVQGMQARSVIFVDHTPGGELATRIRELLTRLEPLLGFKIKVVERCGKNLQSQFPLNNLWQGVKCGREECVTCVQEGAEELPDCSKRSVLYENACVDCIPTAGRKGGPREQDVNADVPALYVGESSRSVMERSREHWAGYRGAKADNHMVRHQLLAHDGAAPPKFIMRVVSHHRSALERQVAEAVRIGRRGGAGAVLNSKSEYNRCYIPRLKLENEEETRAREEQQKLDTIEREQEIERELGAWEQEKTRLRDGERKEQAKYWRAKFPRTSKKTGSKRYQEGGEGLTPGRRKKARVHELLEEDWGERKSSTREQHEEDHNIPSPLPAYAAPPIPCPVIPTAAPPEASLRAVSLPLLPEAPQAPPESQSPDPPPPCTFNRRGVCRLHKVVGEKTTQKERKWTKKKYGYGWTTISSIIYTCVNEIGRKELPGSDLREALHLRNSGINEIDNSESLESSRSLGGAAD